MSHRAIVHCGHCGAGSDYLEAGLDSVFCLKCGHLTDTIGNPLPVEPIYADGHIPERIRPL